MVFQPHAAVTPPMSNERRSAVYFRQNGAVRYTPAQRRRWGHKAGQWLRRQEQDRAV